LFERFGPSVVINLDELHDTVHPWCGFVAERCSPKSHHNLGASAVDLAASNLHNAADGNRFIATEIKNAFEDEIRIQAGSEEGGSIAGLKGQGEQATCIECAVVIGIPR